MSVNRVDVDSPATYGELAYPLHKPTHDSGGLTVLRGGPTGRPTTPEGAHAAGRGWRSALKHGFDRVTAAFLLLLLLPLFIAIAIAVKLSSPGAVFYHQTRVGRHGEHFRFLKFRTMVDGAERLLVDLQDQNECDAVLFKIREDPRITSVGRWLRRFSLDELPQIWHVVTGHMSIVGPRPALPTEAAAWGPAADRRLVVKPGLTGLWQVSGRSDLCWDEAIELDLHYVENWSLVLDTVILAKTIPAVLTGRGAY